MRHPMRPPFLKAAVAAFPFSSRTLAEDAARTLVPFVDDDIAVRLCMPMCLATLCESRRASIFLNWTKASWIPGATHGRRFYASARAALTDIFDKLRFAAFSASTNLGRFRFVVLLAGEYVVEIIEDIVASLSTLDRDDVNFVRENRPTTRRLRSKATSYWNIYYRGSHPDRSTYPALAFLHQLELWAS